MSTNQQINFIQEWSDKAAKEISVELDDSGPEGKLFMVDF